MFLLVSADLDASGTTASPYPTFSGPSKREVVSQPAAIVSSPTFQGQSLTRVEWFYHFRWPFSLRCMTHRSWIDVTFTFTKKEKLTLGRLRRQFSSFELGQSINIWNLIIILASFEFQTAGKHWKLEWPECTQIIDSVYFCQTFDFLFKFLFRNRGKAITVEQNIFLFDRISSWWFTCNDKIDAKFQGLKTRKRKVQLLVRWVAVTM